MVRVVRIVLTLALLAGVYTETGLFTVLCLFLSVGAIEALDALASRREQTRGDQYEKFLRRVEKETRGRQ